MRKFLFELSNDFWDDGDKIGGIKKLDFLAPSFWADYASPDALVV